MPAHKEVCRPLVEVSPAEVRSQLAVKDISDDPELALMAMTAYVLLLQGAVNFAYTKLHYSGALSEIYVPAAAVLDLREAEAQAAVQLLLARRYIWRDGNQLQFLKLQDHLKPRDYFARMSLAEITRLRNQKSNLLQMLMSARRQAQEAYRAWAVDLGWPPADFQLLRGSAGGSFRRQSVQRSWLDWPD